MTIPMLKAFLGEHGLKFLGFEFRSSGASAISKSFRSSGWALTDLDRWHEFETENPDTFSGMYQFWVQKP